MPNFVYNEDLALDFFNRVANWKTPEEDEVWQLTAHVENQYASQKKISNILSRQTIRPVLDDNNAHPLLQTARFLYALRTITYDDEDTYVNSDGVAINRKEVGLSLSVNPRSTLVAGQLLSSNYLAQLVDVVLVGKKSTFFQNWDNVLSHYLHKARSPLPPYWIILCNGKEAYESVVEFIEEDAGAKVFCAIDSGTSFWVLIDAKLATKEFKENIWQKVQGTTTTTKDDTGKDIHVKKFVPLQDSPIPIPGTYYMGMAVKWAKEPVIN